MSYEDRKAIVATVEETYALMGRALSTDVPGELMETAVRGDVIRQISEASVDPYVTDQEMLDLLRRAYFDLVDTVLRLREELLGVNGEGYDASFAAVGLTGSGREVKVRGWRRNLGRFLNMPSLRWIKKAFEWGNIILGSAGGVPVVGVMVDSVKELKESIEAQGEDDQST
ncbi:MAG: hypothetical protein ACYCXF_01100 [Thermoleophilia bacterium]